MTKAGSSSNSPWSVKGVSPAARRVARASARAAGKTIGDWITELIEASQITDNGDAPSLEERLEHLERQTGEAYTGLLQAVETANRRIKTLEADLRRLRGDD